MLKDNIIYVYVYSNDSLDNDISLPDSLLSNINKYKDINKRNIKLTKYNRLLKKVKELGYDTNSFKYINGIPKLDNLYISTSDSKKYYGFSISNVSNGIDIEEEVYGKRYDNLSKYLSNIEYDEYIDAVLKWTIEEAYSKYLGTGITKESLNTKKELNDYFWYKIDKTYITIYKKYYNVVLYLNDKEIKNA